MTEPWQDTKVLLELGSYRLKLCLRFEAAVAIISILSQENVLINDSVHKDGKYVDALTPWGTGDVTIKMI